MTNFAEFLKAEVGVPRHAVTSPRQSTNRRRRRSSVDFLRKRLPAQVGRYLEGVQFPARKEELLGRLERNGVPGPIIGQLRKRLPEGEYHGPQDVLSALRRGVSRLERFKDELPRNYLPRTQVNRPAADVVVRHS